MADGSIRVKTKIDNSGVEKDLRELNALIDKGLGGETANKINRLSAQWEKLSARQSENNAKIREYKAELAELNELKSLNIASGEKSDQILAREQTEQMAVLQSKLERAEANGKGLSASMEKVGVDAGKISASLDTASTGSEKLSSGMDKTRSTIAKLGLGMAGVGTATKAVTRDTYAMGNGISSGIRKLGRYAFALFGIRSVYIGLRRLSSAWLASDAAGAQQVQANINHITNSLASVLGPVITWITDKVMILFGYIQAILKALFGWEMSVAKTSSSMGGVSSGAGKAAKGAGDTAKNLKKAEKEAKKLNKQMAGFDEMNVLEPDPVDSSTGGGGGAGGGAGGGGGGGIAMPMPEISTPDISKFTDAIDKMMEALDPFIETLKSIDFEPLIEAWDDFKDAGLDALKMIGRSFIRVMNNSVGPFIKLLVEDLVPAGLNTVTAILRKMTPIVENLLINFIEPLIHWFLLDFVPVAWYLMLDILTGIFEVAGYVINEFVSLWEEVGRDVSLKAWERLQGFLISIKESVQWAWREVRKLWDEVGRDVAMSALEMIGTIFDGLMTSVEFVIEIFKTFWDIVGKDIALVGLKLIDSIFKDLETIIEFVTDQMKSFITALEEGDPVAEVLAVTLGLVATVLGLIFGWFVLINLMNPFGWAIIAVGLLTTLVASLWYAYDNWDEIKQKASKLWQMFVDYLKYKWGEFKTFFSNKLNEIKQFFINKWEEMKKAGIDKFEELKKSVSDKIQEIKDYFTDLGKKAKEIWEAIKKSGTEKIEDIKVAFKAKIQDIKDFFTDLGKKAGEVWGNIKQVGVDKFEELKQSISDKVESVKGFFTGLETKAGEMWDGIKNKFTTMIGNIKSVFSTTWSEILRLFGQGGQIFLGLKDGIISSFKTIVNALIRGFNRIIKTPFEGLNKILRTMQNIEILGVSPFSWVSTVSIPKIPQLARGGVVNRATLAEVGEGRHSEAVIPLDQDNAGVQRIADLLASQMQGGGSNEELVNVVVNLDGNVLYEAMVKAQRDKDYRTNGRINYGY